MVGPCLPLTVQTTEPGGVTAGTLLGLGPRLTHTTLPRLGTSLLLRTGEWFSTRPGPDNIISALTTDTVISQGFS